MKIKRDIDNCPECGEKHEGLDFVGTSTYAPEITEYGFLGTCPKTHGIFSRRFEVGEEEARAESKP